MLVTRSWVSHERSGVSIIAYIHATILNQLGNNLTLITTHPSAIDEYSPCHAVRIVSAQGSGSLYSPANVSISEVESVIKELNPDLIITEAWQTAITDAFISVGARLKYKVAHVSHGVSVHRFSNSFLSLVREAGWVWYKLFKLPRMIRGLSILGVLSDNSYSKRFYDRILADRLGTRISKLPNVPFNTSWHIVPFQNRKRQIVQVGYFSYVKNQLRSIKILSKLPSDVKLVFIGPQQGAYYKKVLAYADSLNLLSRVEFREDKEIKITNVVQESMLVLCTSITEVLPLTLLESMSSGTPFVSTNVGSISDLQGGFLADKLDDQLYAINILMNDAEVWESHSSQGFDYAMKHFSLHALRCALDTFIHSA